MGVDLVAVTIPIFFFIVGGIIVIISIIYRHKEKAKIFEERRFAMEKGLQVPPMSLKAKNPLLADKLSVIINRKAFVILLFLGIAFMVLSPDGPDDVEASRFVGLVLILLSFAMLINSFIRLKLTSEEKEMLDKDYREKLTISEND